MDESSIWRAVHLIPAADDLEVLRDVSAGLAAEYDTARFTPHLTLYWGTVPPDFDPQHALEKLPAVSAIHCDITGLTTDHAFTKTLFLPCSLSPELSTLHESVKGWFSGSPAYEFDPHISLLYANIGRETKELLKKRIAVPLSRVRFSEVRILGAPPEYRSREDVEREHTLAARLL